MGAGWGLLVITWIPSGAMVTGTQQVDGVTYTFGPDGACSRCLRLLVKAGQRT